jgi:putative flippase GtrA
LLAQVVATVIVLFWNFAANLLWTFRSGSDDIP